MFDIQVHPAGSPSSSPQEDRGSRRKRQSRANRVFFMGRLHEKSERPRILLAGCAASNL
jgi:hypothetical protein